MKVLFVGIAAAFALFGALEILGQPTFYDKLLAVPLLNLSVQALDRIAGSESVQRWTAATFGRYRTALQENSVHMAFWVVLFAAMFFTGEVGSEHRARQVDFWELYIWKLSESV